MRITFSFIFSLLTLAGFSQSFSHVAFSESLKATPTDYHMIDNGLLVYLQKTVGQPVTVCDSAFSTFYRWCMEREVELNATMDANVLALQAGYTTEAFTYDEEGNAQPVEIEFSEDMLKVIDELEDAHWAFRQSEGMYELFYSFENSKVLLAKSRLSAAARDLFDLLLYTNDVSFFADAGIVVSYTELADYFMVVEHCMDNPALTVGKDLIEADHELNQFILLNGTDNSPVATGEMIDDYFLNLYRYFVKTYPKSTFQPVLAKLVQLLEASKLRITPAIRTYMNESTPASWRGE